MNESRKEYRIVSAHDSRGSLTPEQKPATHSLTIDLNKGNRLYNVRLKLTRAAQHIEKLEKFEKYFNQIEFCKIEPKQDEFGSIIWCVTDLQPIPPDVPILIGEAAHQLRTSLDHLLFLFAKPKNAQEERNAQMPICTSARSFRNAKRRLPGIAIGSETYCAIKGIQPFLYRSRPENWILFQLASINNWDKHRALTLAVTSLKTSFIHVKIKIPGYVGNDDVYKIDFRGGVISQGDVIGGIDVQGLPAGMKAKIETDLNAVIQPVFHNSPFSEIEGLSYITLLREALFFIHNDVLPRFDALPQ